MHHARLARGSFVFYLRDVNELRRLFMSRRMLVEYSVDFGHFPSAT